MVSCVILLFPSHPLPTSDTRLRWSGSTIHRETLPPTLTPETNRPPLRARPPSPILESSSDSLFHRYFKYVSLSGIRFSEAAKYSHSIPEDSGGGLSHALRATGTGTGPSIGLRSQSCLYWLRLPSLPIPYPSASPATVSAQARLQDEHQLIKISQRGGLLVPFQSIPKPITPSFQSIYSTPLTLSSVSNAFRHRIAHPVPVLIPIPFPITPLHSPTCTGPSATCSSPDEVP